MALQSSMLFAFLKAPLLSTDHISIQRTAEKNFSEILPSDILSLVLAFALCFC